MMPVRMKMAHLRFLRVLAIALCAAAGPSSGQLREAVVTGGLAYLAVSQQVEKNAKALDRGMGLSHSDAEEAQ